MRRRFRKPLIPAIVALLALGIWAEVRYNDQINRKNDAASASSSVAIDQASPSPSPETPLSVRLPVMRSTATPTPAFAAPPDEAALAEIDKVGLMLRDYRTLAGENPVGTNAEIMASIMGGNPKQAMLGPPEGMQLNDKGELIDRWGTPYFFHQLSRDHMEIRSAGPDKLMWTEDDPVVK